MSEEKITFGAFLTNRRREIMTLRAFAARLGVTPGYISDIENDRRDPPGKELLDKMADTLDISGTDLRQFYDLAGKGRNEVSPDLPDYIMNSDLSDTIRLALRTAKDNSATLEDWLRFIEDVKMRHKAERI